MLTELEEKILEDLESGKDELVIRQWIDQQGLDDELTQFLYDHLEDSRGVKAYRDTQISDANMIIYLGILFMIIAIPFAIYQKTFGALVFGLGIIIYRRGQRRKTKAAAIKSIDSLIPDKRSIFDR